MAVEPDEMNQEVLREKFLRYRIAPKPVVFVGKAASDRETVETMWVAEPGSALNTLSHKWVETLRGDKRRFPDELASLDFPRRKEVETTTLEQLVIAHGLPSFVKIDVEGYEPSVLRGMQRPVPYLSFEVNLPEFRPEGLECLGLLGRLAADGEFNYAVDCQRGLILERWLDLSEFAQVLEGCTETSIEVFWKTAAYAGR